MYDDMHYLISVCCTNCESKAGKGSCTRCKVYRIKHKYTKYTEADYLYDHPEELAEKLIQFFPDEGGLYSTG